MKPFKSFACTIFILVTLHSTAQKQYFNRLKIGDIVPDVEINNIINYSRTSVRLSDFKNSLLILDFWATWCGPCISAFPKIDSLQKKFGNKIFILPVTSENKIKVSSFLQKMKSIKNTLPITVTGDTILDKFFRHTYLPHYVWIKNGNLVGITGKDDVTEYNIEKIIKGEKVAFPVKDDLERKIVYNTEDRPTFIPSLQVQKDGNIQLERMPDSSLVFYSSLTKHLEGLGSGYFMYHPDIFTGTNMSIKQLYNVALLENSVQAIRAGGIILEIEDTSLCDHITSERQNLRGLQFEDWQIANSYCYDIKVPLALVDKKYQIMVVDLNRYFGAMYGIEGTIEQRNSKYLALVRITNDDKMATKGGEETKEIDKFSVKIRNEKLRSVLGSLAQPLQKYPPLIDETNYAGKVDLDLNCELSNLSELNRELGKYGLNLIEKEKMMGVPVIKMKK